MKDIACPIAYQKPLEGGYFRIGLETGYEGFQPGQFGMLEVPPTEGLLLRRPFSFARQTGKITEILYKVVGRGTAALSQAPEGSRVRLLGPLGRGFTVPAGEGDRVGVAGGYGIAPFLEMGRQLKKEEKKLILYYGARSKTDLLYREEFKELGVELHLSTEDGSAGYRGLITELLAEHYLERAPQILWSCGPMGLLGAVNQWSQERGVPCEVSIEETMGCGTGVCLGCVVLGTDGNYRRACVEGPVFDGKEVRL